MFNCGGIKSETICSWITLGVLHDMFLFSTCPLSWNVGSFFGKHWVCFGCCQNVTKLMRQHTLKFRYWFTPDANAVTPLLQLKVGQWESTKSSATASVLNIQFAFWMYDFRPRSCQNSTSDKCWKPTHLKCEKQKHKVSFIPNKTVLLNTKICSTPFFFSKLGSE